MIVSLNEEDLKQKNFLSLLNFPKVLNLGI